MLSFKKILLPLDLEESVLPAIVIRQAAALAHHFQSEVLVLHVVKPLTYLAGGNTVRELIERDVASEEEKLKECLGSELNGLLVRRMVVKGDPAHEILRTVADQKIDLIVMPTHGYGAYERFLVGSVTAKVLHNGGCPVWTAAHVEGGPGQPFAIGSVLCAVDFSTHSQKTVRWAQDVANEFGARLTLAHVTPGVEIYGPGGYHVLADMKQELVDGARKRMCKLQEEVGTKGEVFIGTGDIPKVMSQAAKETKADLLVVGSRSLDHRFGNTAYGIIRESHTPILSV
jgi:nucleotide-binding universal stress UspA family protein